MEGVIKICREGGGGGEVMNKYWADGEINPTHTHTHAHIPTVGKTLVTRTGKPQEKHFSII